MHEFETLADPVRRRILEILSTGEHQTGDIVAAIGEEFGITQSAVSQHLRVLRDSGFVVVRAEATRRYYTLDAEPLRAVGAWIDGFRSYWEPKLDALDAEIKRGKRTRQPRKGGRAA